MNRISATSRIAISITFLSLSVLLAAKLLRMMPEPNEAVVQGRVALCESIAMHCSYLASHGDSRGLESSLTAFVGRNDDMLSAALRRNDGELEVEVGDHTENWNINKDQQSTDSKVYVPIFAADGQWGTMEARFTPVSASGVLGILQDQQVRLFLFAFAGGGLVYSFYLRKVLRHLDPSKVVPSRVRSALDTLAEGLILLDKDDRIVMANGSFAQLVNQSDSQLLGKAATDLSWVNEYGNEVDVFPWTKATQTREAESGTLSFRQEGDERRLTFKVNAVPVNGEDGNHRGVLACFDDVTVLHEKMEELSHLRQELVDTAREAGMAEIATDVLHNVGNVLNSVNVSVTMLSQTLKDSRVSYLEDIAQLFTDNRENLGEFLTNDEKGKRIPDFLTALAKQTSQEQSTNLDEIETVIECVEHIKEIVRMQQSYARVATVLESCNPNELMDDALRFADIQPEQRDIKLVRNFGDVSQIEVSKGKLLQALVNLIRNAKEAIDENPELNRTITLRTMQMDKDHVRLEVEDTGIGIEQSHLTKIFNHGFTTKKSGHGFGLHGSSLAVKEMGGELEVSSHGAGKGATFSIDLPVRHGTVVA